MGLREDVDTAIEEMARDNERHADALRRYGELVIGTEISLTLQRAEQVLRVHAGLMREAFGNGKAVELCRLQLSVQPTGATISANEEHRQRHVDLHKALEELAADYLKHHPPGSASPRTLGNTTVLELVEWSCSQTRNPTEVPRV